MALVAYLREQGKTLRQIGEMVGLSESFVSRVAKGERSFTLDHLALFERRLGEPLSVLIMESVWARTIDAEHKPAYDEALRVLRELGEFRRRLAAGSVAKERRSARGTRSSGKTRRAG